MSRSLDQIRDNIHLRHAINRRNLVIEGDAMVAIVDERLKQIDLGHDGVADALLPIDRLPRRAIEYLQIAVDRITATPERRDIARARIKIAQAAALCLAALDRLPADLPE